jgi:DNA-binding SARP family transcriptional activator
MQGRLHLLGGFRIVSEGQAVAVPTLGAKLLALLAINGRPTSRSRIAGTMWPTVNEHRATANLRSIVWRLPATAQGFVRTSGTTLALAESVDVDLERARVTVRQMLAGELPLDSVQAPVSFLCQPLLPEWDDDWLVFERERIRQLHLHALERLAADLLAAGDALSAVDVGITVIGSEPLRESAHILVIRAHMAAGNRLDARRCYERYDELLRRELNLQPTFRWNDLEAASAASRATTRDDAGRRGDDAAMTPVGHC